MEVSSAQIPYTCTCMSSAQIPYTCTCTLQKSNYQSLPLQGSYKAISSVQKCADLSNGPYSGFPNCLKVFLK